MLLLSKQAGLVISTGYYVGIVTYRILDTHAYVELHVKSRTQAFSTTPLRVQLYDMHVYMLTLKVGCVCACVSLCVYTWYTLHIHAYLYHV